MATTPEKRPCKALQQSISVARPRAGARESRRVARARMRAEASAETRIEGSRGAESTDLALADSVRSKVALAKVEASRSDWAASAAVWRADKSVVSDLLEAGSTPEQICAAMQEQHARPAAETKIMLAQIERRQQRAAERKARRTPPEGKGLAWWLAMFEGRLEDESAAERRLRPCEVQYDLLKTLPRSIVVEKKHKREIRRAYQSAKSALTEAAFLRRQAEKFVARLEREAKRSGSPPGSRPRKRLTQPP